MRDIGFADGLEEDEGGLALPDGAAVAVIGGGPAGSFFSHFFLSLCDRVGLDAKLDLYERKDFNRHAPKGCNHCGGIVSESLVQLLATEGVNLPPEVIQRGIRSYVLHMDVGTVRIRTPTEEKRIAAMYRGAGPKGATQGSWRSFDSFLLDLARRTGARVVPERVVRIDSEGDRPVVTTKESGSRAYDLVVGAVGVNSPSVKLFEDMGFEFGPPEVTKTYICEYHLGGEAVRDLFGDSMHVFLLDIPRLKFAAIIPKGEFVTLCLLGKSIDKELVQSFVASPEVKRCFPEDFDLIAGSACKCYPKINIRPAVRPFADRVVLIGDCAVTRLYKDGIGAAYRTAKAAATTAALQGVSETNFRESYWPVCKSIISDNGLGRLVFAFTRLIQGTAFSKRGILRMVAREQSRANGTRPMSSVLWDTFTGSAPYRDILRRSLNPASLGTLAWETTAGFFMHRKPRRGGKRNVQARPG